MEKIEVVVESRLSQLETTINASLRSFVDVGKALSEIRETRIYVTPDCPTFEQYCQDRFDMKRDYADRLIKASQVVEMLTIVSIQPSTESQARALVPLLDQSELLEKVWQSLVDSGQKITAAVIKDAVAKALTPVHKDTPHDVPTEEEEIPPTAPTEEVPVPSVPENKEAVKAKREVTRAACRELLSNLRSVVQNYEKLWGHFDLMTGEEQMEWVNLVNELERARAGEFEDI